jgi:hypothetical protein
MMVPPFFSYEMRYGSGKAGRSSAPTVVLRSALDIMKYLMDTKLLAHKTAF